MIVFDLDDTLYLERDFAFSGYRRLDGLVQGRRGATGFGEACRALFETGERRHIFDRACAEIGVDAGPDLIAELVDAYRAHTPTIALCPDAETCLSRLPAPLGLITDGPAHMQRNKISALGLVGRIAHIRPTGDWPPGFGKPNPRAYEEMETLSGPDARSMVYVADNPAKDFITPKARGWTTVQICRDGAIHDPIPPDDTHAPTARIDTLDDLEGVLARLRGR